MTTGCGCIVKPFCQAEYGSSKICVDIDFDFLYSTQQNDTNKDCSISQFNV